MHASVSVSIVSSRPLVCNRISRSDYVLHTLSIVIGRYDTRSTKDRSCVLKGIEIKRHGFLTLNKQGEWHIQMMSGIDDRTRYSRRWFELEKGGVRESGTWYVVDSVTGGRDLVSNGRTVSRNFEGPGVAEEPEDDAEGNASDLLDRQYGVDVDYDRYWAVHAPVPILLVVGV